MTYAVISLGGKQYRVRQGQRLLVDRLPYEEGKTFHPELLLVGSDGQISLGAGELKGHQVTATVTKHLLGEKIVVFKHRKRTGYQRKNGHRSRLSQIEIASIGKRASRAKKQAVAKEAGEEG